MRSLAPILAVSLVVTMTPGAFELIENAVHLVTHGDTAHGESHEQESSHESDDEHGCSGPYHFCACHHSMSFVVASYINTTAALPSSVLSVIPSDDALDSGFVRRLLRPPTA